MSRLEGFRCVRCVLLVAMVISLGGCGKREQAKSPESLLKIAVIPKGTIHEYWKSIHAGALKAEAESKGVQIIWKGPVKEDDREQQINVVENFISAGVSGIVVSPLDEVALLKPVRDAQRAGIPVIIMDSGLKGEAGKDFVSYIATDNVEGGRKAAGRMIQVLGGSGKVIVFRYQVGSASTTQREEGFIEGIRKQPEVKIISDDQYGGPTSDTACTKAENLLNRFADVDGIFCACEPMAFGVLRALQQSGRAGKVKLIAFDPSDKLIEAMKAGQVHGIVLQDPVNMGYVAVRNMVAHLRGERIPARIDTGSEVATPENMNQGRIHKLLRPLEEMKN